MKTQLEVKDWEAVAGFEVNLRRCDSGWKRFSAACLEKFHALEQRILVELGFRFENVRPEFLRQAVNEAAALAESTGFPSLFLPALAEEKVSRASEWERRQREIQERSWLQAA